MNQSAIKDTLTDQASDIDDYVHQWFTIMGEWYLVGCFAYLMLEGACYAFIADTISTRAYWFTRLTPYNLWPSILYFYGVGFVIGTIIIIGGRRPWHVPIKGVWAYLALWFVYVGWGVYGAVRHNPFWHRDIRSLILPGIVVPWAVVLAQNIRYEVVLSRIVKVAMPFAILNFVLGMLHFARGGYTPETALFQASWKIEYILLFAYIVTFARNITRGSRSVTPMIILALGILAPLHKPVLATFVLANIVLMYFAGRAGIGRGTARVGKTILVLLLLIVICAGVGKILLEVGEGAVVEHLRFRIFKHGTRQDITGGRIDIWSYCLDRWRSRPVLGVGLGERAWSEQLMEPSLHIHSLAVQTLMQTGVMGSFLVAVAVFIWLRRATKTLRLEHLPQRFWTRLALVSYVCVIMLSSLYGEPFHIRALNFTFWFVVALETAAHSQTICWLSTYEVEYTLSQYDPAYAS